MSTRVKLISLLFLVSFYVGAQSVRHVYKIDQLLSRIDHPDTTYILNFWAIWCKPCIQELPAFDSLNTTLKSRPVKMLLVNIDFVEDKEKVNAFLEKKKIMADCVLLDEINGNSYIDRISKDWNGSIPATFFKNKNSTLLIEKKMHKEEIQRHLYSVLED